MKRHLIIGKMILLVLLLVGLSSIGTDVKASEKSDIKSTIANRLSGGEVVKKVYFYDYDKNGRKEAFVLTGDKKVSEREVAICDLWFAYKRSGTVYATIIREDVTDESKPLKLKSQSLFLAAEYCTTSTPMGMYKVDGYGVKEIFAGDWIAKVKGNVFTSVHSTYDFSFDKGFGSYCGHTWKKYWFYYKNGKVYQYKARKISKKAFKKKYKNANKILKKYKKYGKVNSILYRSNGLIHINYEKEDTSSIQYMNVTLKVKKRKLTKPVVDGGTYLKEL